LTFPVDHLYAAPVLMKAIRERGIDQDLVVVSPDVGGIKMTHAFAKALKAPMAIVAKNRVSAEEVEAHSVIGDVAGKNVLLVDDLTETAGTLTAAASCCSSTGRKKSTLASPTPCWEKRATAASPNPPSSSFWPRIPVPQATGESHRPGHRPAAGPGHRRIHGNESVTSCLTSGGRRVFSAPFFQN
jgi:ribose-phosphate pyrophosphokinase